MLESSSLLVGGKPFSARLMAGIGATGQRNRPARNDRPPRSAEESKTESVMTSRSILRSAKSPSILVVSLVLLCAATPVSLGHPPTQAGHAGKFPVGVLTSKGNLQLTGRVDWGRGGGSVLPMVYDGTRIHLKRGKAELELLMGGRLNLCRDTDLTVQQPRSPFLFTLHSGRVAYDLPRSQGDLFLTPDFLIRVEPDPQARPEACRGEIGLESDGTICVRSDQGLLVITAQDYSETIAVPPGPGMRIVPGRIASPEYFQDCDCAGPLSSPEGNGPGVSAYGAGGSSGKSPWRSFLRTLIKILTLGLV
jgi:hypothetical protein